MGYVNGSGFLKWEMVCEGMVTRTLNSNFLLFQSLSVTLQAANCQSVFNPKAKIW